MDQYAESDIRFVNSIKFEDAFAWVHYMPDAAKRLAVAVTQSVE